MFIEKSFTFAASKITADCCFFDAGIAQLVEHDLAKVGVASSSLVSRSQSPESWKGCRAFFLENDCSSGGIGRHVGLKIQ